MIRYVKHLFTGVALAASLSCSLFASAQTIYVTGGGGVFGTLNPTTGIFSSRGNTGVTLSGIAFSPTGVLYGINQSGTTLYTVNPNTGALTTVGATGLNGLNADGLAFRSDGTLFLAFQTASLTTPTTLYTVNPATGLATARPNNAGTGIETTGTIGFDGAGNLFLTDNTNTGINGTDVLRRFDQTVGTAAFVGNTVNAQDIFGLAYSGGILYGFDANNQVFNINTATGVATNVHSYSLGGATLFAATPFVAAVPEPSTLALLMGMSVTGTSVFLRRKRSNSAA